eukprot:TRINITY_DN31088_c0_g2_i3.p1 TRINITY_DN31088_c0_g2~~TRINITY_DN31088_c0_g2_i3.p1  ORF type:complete len:620 (-),score=177.16 TRINITY_DN31088_c0_g2_i3:354-2117(-)
MLVNSNCDLEICDFGLSRLMSSERRSYMTDYVATRWYRAPELILSSKSYTKAVDMWSVGCALAELLGRKPIFPGQDSQHQLALITSVLGTPTDQQLARVEQVKARAYMMRMRKKEKIPWKQLYPKATDEALDLLDKLLTFFPEDRMTVQQAIEHPFFKDLHFDDEEPTGDLLDHRHFDFENLTLGVEDYRFLIAREIRHYHPHDSQYRRLVNYLRPRKAKEEGSSKNQSNSGSKNHGNNKTSQNPPNNGTLPVQMEGHQANKKSDKLFNTRNNNENKNNTQAVEPNTSLEVSKKQGLMTVAGSNHVASHRALPTTNPSQLNNNKKKNSRQIQQSLPKSVRPSTNLPKESFKTPNLDDGDDEAKSAKSLPPNDDVPASLKRNKRRSVVSTGDMSNAKNRMTQNMDTMSNNSSSFMPAIVEKPDDNVNPHANVERMLAGVNLVAQEIDSNHSSSYSRISPNQQQRKSRKTNATMYDNLPSDADSYMDSSWHSGEMSVQNHMPMADMMRHGQQLHQQHQQQQQQHQYIQQQQQQQQQQQHQQNKRKLQRRPSYHRSTRSDKGLGANSEKPHRRRLGQPNSVSYFFIFYHL